MLDTYGFSWFQPGSDPASDRTVVERGGLRTTLVPVREPAAVVPVAVELVAGGAQLIELCGVFGPVWTARVVEATGGRVPVGAVGYGVESVASLAAVTQPEG